MRPFAEKVALVTGAGSGIGRAIALALGDQGAALAMVGRRHALLDEVATSVVARGAKAHCFPTDLCDRAAIQDLTAGVLRSFDGLDLMVHSAASVRLGDFTDGSADDFDLLYRTNVLAPYLLTQAMLPVVCDRKGQIVFINSSVGVTAPARAAQYASTKHALKSIADSLRAEVNGDGVRVLSVFVGQTATPTQQRLHDDEHRPYRPERLLQPEDVASVVVGALCLPRTAEVTDIHIRPMLKAD